MPKISLIINCDTRPERNNEGGLFNGTVNIDYLSYGIANKIKFLDGYEIETIVYIDQHEPIPQDVLDYLIKATDCLIIRKHTDEVSFNCWNYWRALSMASGDIVCHFDQDTNGFTASKQYVDELISHLDNYKFVSYPSHWTPKAVYDESFGTQTWASTRFFLCKRENLKLGELAECIKNPDWMYEKYGDSKRRVNWVEHFLAKINDNSVYYPPVELHKGTIFTWSSYSRYVLMRLNELPYEEIKQWILHRGGIQYPVDIKCE